MKRVFIFSSHPLLARGIEALLVREAGIEIVGCETSLEKAVACIMGLRPDIVIVDAHECAANRAALLTRVLHAGICNCIIGMNVEDNTIQIYRGEQLTLRNVEEFLQAMRS